MATEIRCTYVGGPQDGLVAFVPTVPAYSEQYPVPGGTNKAGDALFATYVRVAARMQFVGYVLFGRASVDAAARAEGIDY
jgi:hypothetical protein